MPTLDKRTGRRHTERMTRYGVPRAEPAAERIACLYLPGLPSEGGEAILRGLTVIAGPAELPNPRARVLFFKPEARARLYGGLVAWATTVRSYVSGRNMSASLVVGFDAHRLEVIARSRPIVRVFATAEDERLAVCALKVLCVGLTAEERELVASRNVRTVRELASTTHPELSKGRARARALIDGIPQLGLGFAEPASSMKRSA